MSDREKRQKLLDEFEEILAEFQMTVAAATGHAWDLFDQRVIAWSSKVANEFGEETRRAIEIEIGEWLASHRLPPGGFTDFQQRAVRARSIIRDNLQPVAAPAEAAGASGTRFRFGIVTALPKEFAAMRTMLEAAREDVVDGDPNDYVIGSIPASDGSGEHRVVVTLLKKAGNNTAAAAAVNLLRSFPDVEDVLMVGIAGGVPHPTDADKHVRLGDIVVSNECGVLQYDNVKLAEGIVEVRSTSSPPSAALIGRTRILEAGRLAGKRPWEEHIKRADHLHGVARPKSSTDRLYSTGDPTAPIRHPRDPNRSTGRPRVHYGRIGSANVLLRDPKRRDALRDQYAAKAIEMEGSGIADGTWQFSGKSYMLIRGISDYCDSHKNDKWQGYGSVVAAAYARAVIESFPARTDPAKLQARARAQGKLEQARNEVDASEFEKAASLAEDAAGLASAAEDPQLEAKAHVQAAAAWGELIVVSGLRDPERTRLLHRIDEHIDAAERLGVEPARLALERASVARLWEKPDEVLAWASKVAEASGTDPGIEGAALVIRLQALWQLGRLEEALALQPDIERLRPLLDGDDRLVLDATWLRTLCKAERATPEALRFFADELRDLVERSKVHRRRVTVVIGEVAAEFNRAERAEDTLALSELAYEIAEPLGNAAMSMNISMQAAELASVLRDAARARLYLGRAQSWFEKYRAQDADEPEISRKALRANLLFARGRTLARLGSDSGTSDDESTLRDAYDALSESRSIVEENRPAFGEGVEVHLADVSNWLGRVTLSLGRPADAAAFFREVRSDAARANRRFWTAVGVDAWLRESESLRLAGRVREARAEVERLLADPRTPAPVGQRARAFREYLDRRELPLLDWFDSDDAVTIARRSVEVGLRPTVAEQFAPLLSWWSEWRDEKGAPESGFLDFWGRGGFARITAAVRRKPHAAIAVDARSVSEIATWARVLCPLFDTVLVKWKGELGAGLLITPMHIAYGGAGAFGGWGYNVTASMPRDRADWRVAMAWANPLPREVSAFLAGDAISLLRAGRLVVLPAPLVGCVQSGVGWTDDLLVSGFLGGVVNVGRRVENSPSAGAAAVLDLSSISVPFIDGITLADLAVVLEDAEEWVHPLRALLLRAIPDFQRERWDSRVAVESDIKEAFRLLREKLASLVTKRRSPSKWRVRELPSALSARARASSGVGHEPITDLLRSVSPAPAAAGPWVIYWLLEGLGGHLDWTAPLDNPSEPPRPEAGAMELPPALRTPEVQTWLYPGTGGWGIPTAVRIF